jgi:hypothetical protein
MNLRDAMQLQIGLHNRGWLYHFDDNTHECLSGCENPPTEWQCGRIYHHVQIMLNAHGIDWGLFDDAYGFAIALHNDELKQWLSTLDHPEGHGFNFIWSQSC